MLAQRRNPFLRLLILGVGLILVLNSLTACTFAPKRIPEEVILQIDTALGEMTEKKRFSGSILIAQEDQVLLSKGYGMADVERGVPNSPQTRFRICSISKEFTASAILMLQDQGKLNVQENVCEYIADCPAAWQEITIHHLLTHTSGIPNQTFFDKIAGRQEEQFTPVELLALFRDAPLDFEPGKEWRYSNPGYIVLGYVIEQVSGQSYAEFLQENIFTPLSLLNTGYEDLQNAVAAGYSNYGMQARKFDISHPYAAGGLYSTVEDLFHWVRAFQTDPYFSKDAFAPMFTPYAAAPTEQVLSKDASYGYGWEIGERNGQRLIGHSGGYYGFAGLHAYYPDDQITIVVLSNMDYEASSSALTLPSDIIFGEE